jgi:hypothetical protein
MTFFYKKIFPAIWFGGLALFTIVAVGPIATEGGPYFMLIIPFVMAIFGYLLMRMLVFDLVDAVYLDRHFVYWKNGDRENRAPLEDVLNINNVYLNKSSAAA